MGIELANFFSESGFMPHGHCYLWTPSLLWTVAIANALIGIAYVAISLTLYALVRKIRIPFTAVGLSFGVFIGACGLTHLLNVWTIWRPNYWVSALVDVITAIASVATGVWIVKLRHEIVRVANAARLVELEEALDRQRQELQSIIDGTPNTVILVKDLEGRYLRSNRYLESLLGLSREQIHGKTDHELMPLEMASVYRAEDTKVLQSGESSLIEEPFRGKQGEEMVFLSSKFPLRDSEGRMYALCGVSANITEQKKTQAELRAAMEEAQRASDALKEAVRARDEFLSIASHELKTPLSSLRLQAQLFKRSAEKGDPQAYSRERIERFVDQAERQTARLARLVEDMLDIARIRSGKLTIEKERFDLCELLHDVEDRLKPAMKQAHILVTVQCDGKVEGVWDRFRIEQVVTNLLTNAMRYGEQKPVTVILRQEGSVAHFSVRDQGMGISKEAQERIFDRFERAVSPSEVSGLGLGLFITRQIVEAHGGKIWVESKGPGTGATFFVELPL